MKRIVSLVCAAMLCVCCVALAACGGSPASSASSSAAANPAANFVGTWKLAGAEAQGLTVVGDFSAMVGIENGFQITLNEDGTCKATMGDDTKDFTWEVTGDNTMKMNVAAASEGSSASSASASAESAESADAEDATAEDAEAVASELSEFTLEDGKLMTTMAGEGQSATLIFTQDGTIPGAMVIDSANATPITSEADLIGEWKLSGMNFMGMSAYGDSDAIAQMAGGADMSLKFEEGGKCTMSGEEVAYTVSADGAAIAQGGVEIPIKALDGNIIIDASAATGLDMTMIMLYSK